MGQKQRTVVILGASDRVDRYSYKALKSLLKHGFKVIPVHPVLSAIEGIEVVASLGQVQEAVDTVTVYVGARKVSPLLWEIIRIAPQRVVFNPGTESPEFEEELRLRGIEVIEDCTLVMLREGTF